MAKEINCSAFKSLLDYLRKHHGEHSVRQVIDGLVNNERYLIADKINPSNIIPVQEYHLNDSAYWVSNEFSLALFANSKKIIGDSKSLAKIGEISVEHFFSKKSILFLSRVLGVKQISKQVAKINNRFNRTKKVKLTELTDNKAVFQIHYHPNFRTTKDICNWNLGIYVGTAKMAGGRDVRGKEIQCVLNGDDFCAIQLTWKKEAFFIKRLLRSVLKLITSDLIAEYEDILNEREHLIEHLTESEERYRTLTDQSLTGIFIHRNGNILYANDGLAKMLGYRSNEMIGKKFWDFLHPEDLAFVKEREMDRLSGGDAISDYEFRVHNKNNELLWLGIFATTINYNGQKAGMGNIIDLTLKKQAELALQESRTELERRVAERTEKLSWSNKFLKKQITERIRAEQELTRSLQEKELLIKEIHHRVKNNLQIISSLLDMRSMRSSDREACKILEDAQAKIYNMALIHTQLYQRQPFDQINMERHVEDLFSYLSEVYAHMKNVVVPIIDCSDVCLSVTQAIPCAVIINELVSNAFKHAFNKMQKGKIEIYMKNFDDNRVLIRIKDNGIGITNEIDIQKLDSLGLKLVANLVQIQLKGKMQIQCNKGTEVTISF